MTIDTNKVYEVLDNAKTAFEALSSTLREVIGQVKDISEENQRLHDTNQQLREAVDKQRENIVSFEQELYATRRNMRDFEAAKITAESSVEGLRLQLDEAKAECVKLREIILNVASLADPVVNPKAPEVAKPSSGFDVNYGGGHDDRPS